MKCQDLLVAGLEISPSPHTKCFMMFSTSIFCGRCVSMLLSTLNIRTKRGHLNRTYHDLDFKSCYVEFSQTATSTGHISETKQDFLDALVPNFPSHRGLSPSATLSLSFGLFQSEKAIFRGVPGECHRVSLVSICPRDPLKCKRKQIYSAPHTFTWPLKFVISFV